MRYDRHLPAWLAWRGMAPKEARLLLADFSRGDESAHDVLALTLPAERILGREIAAQAVISHAIFAIAVARGIRWRGNHLTFSDTLPETMCTALIGRPLGDAISHPGLPVHRTILDARPGTDGTVIVVEEDLVSHAEARRIGPVDRLTSPLRRVRRVRQLNALTGGDVDQRISMAVTAAS